MRTGNATELDLEDTLCDYIAHWTIEDAFLSKIKPPDSPEDSDPRSQIARVSPAVHPGMVPRDVVTGFFDVNAIPKWPFILVQIENWYDMIPEGCIYTRIIAGVYDPDERCQGYRDAIYLIRKITRRIWYEGMLADNFPFNPREKIDGRVLPSREVTHPYYMADVLIPWQLRTPYIREESDQELRHPQPTKGTLIQPIAAQTRNNLDTESETYPIAGWPYNQ